MPEWLVWASSFTVPVRVPVSGDVGCFEQETANKKRKKRVRELREFSRIVLREFLNIFIEEGYLELINNQVHLTELGKVLDESGFFKGLKNISLKNFLLKAPLIEKMKDTIRAFFVNMRFESI